MGIGSYSEERFITEYNDYIVYKDIFIQGVDYIIRSRGKFERYTFMKGRCVNRKTLNINEVFDIRCKYYKFLLSIFRLLEYEVLFIFFMYVIKHMLNLDSSLVPRVLYSLSISGVFLILLMFVKFFKKEVYGREFIINFLKISIIICICILLISIKGYNINIKITSIFFIGAYSLVSTCRMYMKFRLNEYFEEFIKIFKY